MKKEFVFPLFSDVQCLEFRFENDVACIYGNGQGLSFLKMSVSDFPEMRRENSLFLKTMIAI